jgi:hypothetical protein
LLNRLAIVWTGAGSEAGFVVLQPARSNPEAPRARACRRERNSEEMETFPEFDAEILELLFQDISSL